MKIAILMLGLLMTSSFAFAFDPDQALKTVNLSKNALNNKGMRVLLGEVTGAGRVPLQDLEMILLEREVVFKHEITDYQLNHSDEPKVSDILSFVVEGQHEVDKSEIKAVVIK